MTHASNSGTGRGDFHVLYHGQSVDELIINYMEENDVPGMALAIVQAPYITRIVGYGLADIQTKTLVGSHTTFDIGQLTQAFTAVAIVQLKEEGKLKLDDVITTYLSDAPVKWQSITIRQLIAHVSGIADYTTVKGFDYGAQYTPAQIIAFVKDSDLQFEPGAKVQNSQTNNYLLGLIIEKASGMSYQDYVTKNQIERMGLKHTYFIANQADIKNELNNGTNPFKHSEFLHNVIDVNPIELATGHSEVNGVISTIKQNSWTATFANSGIIASAEDISIWDIGLAGDILVKDPADKAFIYSPATLKNGQTVPGNANWVFPGHPGLMEIKGNIPGYSAFLSRFTQPSELLCVTLLANKSDLPDLNLLARKIAGAFDEKLAAPLGSPSAETIQSPYSVQETLDRVETLAKANGAKIFARIDHSAEASSAGQTLPPTQVLIIGNPAQGTAFMQADPAMALDLPLRLMAYKDSVGNVWLSFVDPLALAWEYDVDEKHEALLTKLAVNLRKLCEKAVSVESIPVAGSAGG